MLLSLAVLAARHGVTGSTELSSRSLNDPATTRRYCFDGKLTGEVGISAEPGIRTVVSVTCVLSMVGAVLIILSYVLIKDIRTKAREILLNLSLMDFFVAAANMVGILVDFDDTLSHQNATQGYINLDGACRAQAFIAMYCTISSILWTNCIAIYIYFHIMLEGRLNVFWTMFAFYVLSYGLPLIVNIWFLMSGKLGYSPYGSSGWCSVIVYNHTTNQRYPLTLVFANDIWIYVTITLVPLIFISLKFHLKQQLKGHHAVLTSSVAVTVHKVEMKLIFIPITFLLLRVWSLLLTVIEIEAGKKLSCNWLIFFIYLGGIGDSGQGFANAILFVLFTPKVMRHFLRLLLCHCLRRKSQEAVNVQSTTKIFYGTVPSNSDYRTDCSDSPCVSDGVNAALCVNKSGEF